MQTYDDKAQADYFIDYNPEMYPNGTLCQTQDDGALFIAFNGTWLQVSAAPAP